MRVLLVAATEAEIAPTYQALSEYPERTENRNHVRVCITGVGMMATAYELGKTLAANHWDYVIGAGIAGSFSRALKPGDCVIVESEQLADLGAEDGDEFLDIFSLGQLRENEAPFHQGLLRNPLQHPPFSIHHLPRVPGLTVNTVSGCEATIARRMARCAASVESMEGAALHYVCLREKVPFIQLRSISNYVTRRDRSSWRIAEAIAALNAQLASWLL
ncbi:MAG: futalosine hydrolase [Bacteroidetes bacterium]|nr:futalosine hydrolase [Bacteroidota bacterium]MBS1628552.1 futalosine hydrolase [Bacteroidota bacterium]